LIIDARSLPENKTVETDVCIVGAGVAGITLARECIGEAFRVCLLESGGLEPDKITQSLYWGENVGHPYYPLDTSRARFFGGTSHYWKLAIGANQLGVRLRDMDKIDFEERDWIPYSGWPFDKAHLVPFYERAQSICKIGPFTYNVEDWEDPVNAPRLHFVNDQVKTTIFQFGLRDLFFDKYRGEISNADNITTYLHANVVDIETTENAQDVTRLRVACLKGNKFWVSAKLFVLAMGGIETPRLLLLSNNVQRNGLGNQHDLVGRFFMEHPHLWSGVYVPSELNISNSTSLYKIHRVNDVPIMGKLTLNNTVLRREKLLNYCVSINPDFSLSYQYFINSASKGIDSLRALRSAFQEKRIPDNFSNHIGNVITDISSIAKTTYRKITGKFIREFKKSEHIAVYKLNHMAEQVPNPNSRVTLSNECDALGQRRVQLNWQLSPIDILSMVRSQEIIDEELTRAGLGRLKIELNGDTPPPDLHGGWHHMGTTRMHLNPKKGVVNENCRVHGISNLFIAGASVFPTCGYANPVLTTIALVVRLADHIKKNME
jgi:choline dehydrogenase-like flavoprotein